MQFFIKNEVEYQKVSSFIPDLNKANSKAAIYWESYTSNHRCIITEQEEYWINYIFRLCRNKYKIIQNIKNNIKIVNLKFKN